MNEKELALAVNEVADGFVVVANTDLTEGRGAQIPIAVCWSETTAKRIGRKRDVQGSDATVLKTKLYRINQTWYGPVHVQSPDAVDTVIDKKKADRQAAIERARALGLSEQDINTLYQQINEQ